MKLLIIIRGVPGSGKTTLANTLFDRACQYTDTFPVEHCEADDFFKVNGEYKYIPHLVPAAHQWCQRKAFAAMERGDPTVIVSNTSTIRPRIDFYVETAAKFDYKVQQIVLFADLGTVHPMPEETKRKFANQLRASLMHELQMGELLPCQAPSILKQP